MHSPEALHVAACATVTASEHCAGAQSLLAVEALQALAPSQVPVPLHTPVPRVPQSPSGSVDFATGPQVPSAPEPFLAFVHASQSPSQALSQQTSSAQKPLVQSSFDLHAFAAHMDEA
jgi:hypothetical protein